QALISEIEPGGGSGPGHYTLPTKVEFVFVLHGRLEINVVDLTDTNTETLILDAGDAFTFPAANKHAFRAVDGTGPPRVLWAFSPALPATDRSDNSDIVAE